MYLENIEFFEIPTVTTYTLNFNAGTGGSGTQTNNPMTSTTSPTFTLPECTFTAPANKLFDGWGTSNSSDSKISGTTFTITSGTSATLYALWKDKPATGYTINFNGNNNGAGGSESPLFNENTASFNLPTTTGFTAPADKEFDGWSETVNGDKITANPYTPTMTAGSSKTLYARWKDIIYTDLPVGTYKDLVIDYSGSPAAPSGTTVYAEDTSFIIKPDEGSTYYKRASIDYDLVQAKYAGELSWIYVKNSADVPTMTFNTNNANAKVTSLSIKYYQNNIMKVFAGDSTSQLPASAGDKSDGNWNIQNYTVNNSAFSIKNNENPSGTGTSTTRSIYSMTLTVVVSHTCTADESVWESNATQHWHPCTYGLGDCSKFDLANHSFGDLVIDTDSTYTQTGTGHRVCSVCHYEKIETIPVKEHNYDSVWHYDDTQSAGHYHICTDAGFTDLHSATQPHAYGDLIIDEDSDFDNAGSGHKICSACNYRLEVEIPVKQHTFDTVWHYDDTQSAGHYHICTDTGYSDLHSETVAHTFGDWITDTAATASQPGTKHRICSACSFREEGVIPRLPSFINYSSLDDISTEGTEVLIASQDALTKTVSGSTSNAYVFNFSISSGHGQGSLYNPSTGYDSIKNYILTATRGTDDNSNQFSLYHNGSGHGYLNIGKAASGNLAWSSNETYWHIGSTSDTTDKNIYCDSVVNARLRNYGSSTFRSYGSNNGELAYLLVNAILKAPVVTVSGTTLSWAAIGNATSYDVYVDGTKVGSTSSLSYDIGNSSIGTHSAYVKACTTKTGYYDSDQSNTVSVVVAELEPVSTPTGLSVNGLNISWNAVTDSNGYVLKINGVDHQIAAGTTSYTVDAEELELTPEVDYEVSVKACGDYVNNKDSEFSSAVTLRIPAPHVLTIEGPSYVGIGSNSTFNVSCSSSAYDIEDTFTWSLNNDKATLSSTTGSQVKITGVTAGEVTITVTCSGGGTETKTIEIKQIDNDFGFVNGGKYIISHSKVDDDNLETHYYLGAGESSQTVATTELEEAVVFNLTLVADNTIELSYDTNKWLYCNAANNGVRLGNPDGAEGDQIRFLISEGTIADATGEYDVKNVAHSRWLTMYNTQDFRCYTDNTTNRSENTYITQVFDVTFNVDGAETSKITKINEIPAYGSTPSKEGMEFLGWATSPSGTPSMTIPVATEDVTYYAIFGSLKKTVTYVCDGEGTLPEVTPYDVDETVTVTSVVPTKTGKIFDGWSDGKGNTYYAGDEFKMPNENVTLTAQWKNADETLSVDVGFKFTGLDMEMFQLVFNAELPKGATSYGFLYTTTKDIDLTSYDLDDIRNGEVPQVRIKENVTRLSLNTASDTKEATAIFYWNDANGLHYSAALTNSFRAFVTDSSFDIESITDEYARACLEYYLYGLENPVEE